MDSKEERWEHWDDLPPQKSEEMLEEMAEFVVKKDLQLLAQIFFESGEPFTRVFSTLGLGLFGPFLEFFKADQHMAFFREEGKMRELINRIDELDEAKDLDKKENKKGKD